MNAGSVSGQAQIRKKPKIEVVKPSVGGGNNWGNNCTIVET